MTNKTTILLLLIGFVLSICTNAQQQINTYKGQLHCHSTESDGKISPDSVAIRYKSDGYDFITLSDHWRTTDISHHNTNSFLTFATNEISPKRDHIHAIGTPYGFTSEASNLQEGIDHTLEAGGLAMINHPQWSGHSLDKLLETSGAIFLEVLNSDDKSHLIDLERWDGYLSENRQIFGVGTDDAHNYNLDSPQYNECWIEVYASELSKNELLKSMKSGDFSFVDRGQEISDKRVHITRVDQHNRTLTVVSDAPMIQFYGKNGMLLDEVEASSASYTLPENELYVRAVATNGIQAAYAQAYFPEKYDANAGSIIAPMDNERIEVGESIRITFTPNNPEELFETKLFANNKHIATLAADQTSIIWENVEAGQYTVKARFEVSGAYYWSNAIQIICE